MTARTQLFQERKALRADSNIIKLTNSIAQQFTVKLEENRPVCIEKIVTLFTSRDKAVSNPSYDGYQLMREIKNFADITNSHHQAWRMLWQRCDIKIQFNPEEQLLLRLHIFHLLQTISPHSIDLDVSAPARGLHGEAYRGHVFWDELYIFHFFTSHFPEITRSLLLYRYRRLFHARKAALKIGLKGAMFPWQSGSNGEEETQIMHLNPRDNTWGPDYSHLQRHVNIAIAYNIWQYYLYTNDLQFMSRYGAEMLLDIAIFWSSLVIYNKESDRYEIHGVMGPDEYHEKYPNSIEPRLRNNAYTNFMIVWLFERALQIMKLLSAQRCQELLTLLDIDEQEIRKWRAITRRMYLPLRKDKILNQFDGYEELTPFPWKQYQKKYGRIERLDRILKAENDTPDHYQLAKQAYVMMIFYLLPSSEVKQLMQQLGYSFEEADIEKNIVYYLNHTSHGSTLSKIVYASTLMDIQPQSAKELYYQALSSDVNDIQGGTTPEGIHLGVMGATAQFASQGYSGLYVSDFNELIFKPTLPSGLKLMNWRFQYRSVWYDIELTENKLMLRLCDYGSESVTVKLNNKTYQLQGNQTLVLSLDELSLKS